MAPPSGRPASPTCSRGRRSARCSRCCRSTCSRDFLRTGHVTGLLLLASESLVVVLTIVRRRAQLVDRSVAAAAGDDALGRRSAAAARAATRRRSCPTSSTALVSAVGLVLVVVGKIALGRSFGLVPANRGVVVRGPYTLRAASDLHRLPDHARRRSSSPYPTPWNVVVIADRRHARSIVRALMEERVLSEDVEYRATAGASAGTSCRECSDGHASLIERAHARAGGDARRAAR